MGASLNEGRTLWGWSLTCRWRPFPKTSISVERRVEILGAGGPWRISPSWPSRWLGARLPR